MNTSKGLENSKQWRKILESTITNSATPTLFFASSGKLVFFSRSFVELWNLQNKDFLNDYNIFEDKQLRAEGVIPLVQKAFDGEVPEEVEILYDPAQLSMTGKPLWIRANAYPVGSDKHIVDGVIVNMEDITSIKETAERVVQNNEILMNFMDSASDALVIYDNELNYIEVNRKASEMIGRTRSEIIGKNIKEIIPDIDKTGRYDKYLELLKTGETLVEEVADHPFAPGKIIQIKAFKLAGGLGILSSDITRSKEELHREISLNKELEFLKDTAMDLVEMNFDDDLYSYIARKISSICNHAYVVINMLDPETKRVVVKGVSGEYRYRNFVETLIGNPLISKSFPFYRNHKKLKTGKLFQLNIGLYEIMGKEFPRNISRAIEKTLNIKRIFSIGFIRKDKLYGNALILLNDEQSTINTPLIEAFINQISIAIHRTASERALRDSEKRFEIAFSTSPDSVNINRLNDGIYVEINDGFTEVTGYTREDVIGVSSLEKGIWVNPDDRKWLVNELSKKRIIKNMEAEFRTKSGEIKVGLMSAHIFTKDGVDHIISITRDITDRKQAERSLKESEERYRIVARQTGQIIYDYDISTGVISWAGAIEEVTGYSPEEFSKVDISVWETLVHPDDLQHTKKLLQHAEDSMGSFDAEYRFKRKDGRYISIEEHGLCITDEDGKSKMLGSMADITERNNYQDSLKLAWKKAVESDKLKTAFLANISHEIRTPMNAILGFSDLLMNTKASETNKAEYINLINRSSYNLLNIINDIIDFSMIETDQFQIHKRECSLNEMIRELHGTFKQYKSIEGKEHLEVLVDPSFLAEKKQIIADEERIKQVMSNLIANAIKYTEQGKVEFGYDIHGYGQPEARLEFFVRDTGVGIAKEHQEVIFERFRQLEDSNTRKYGGNGLGLSISKQIANLMGGDIKLISEPGKGSIFYFNLPYEDAKTAQNPSTPSQTQYDYDWREKRVIVAEDVSSNYYLIQSMLQETAVHLDWARNGAEVLELFNSEEKYDLILMDIRMPGMNGYEATAEIRKSDQELPIIALSANAMQDDRDQSIAMGCNDHLSKPFTMESLFGTMVKYL